VYSHYGEIVARLRTNSGFERKALAKRINISTTELAELERTSSRPSQGLLERLSVEFGLTTDEIDCMAGLMPQWAMELMRVKTHDFLEALRQIPTSGVKKPLQTAISGKQPELVLETGLGRLYRGDCRDLMASIENESIDLVFADPPFNLDKDYGIGVEDDLPEQRYLEWCSLWLLDITRILKPGGSLFLYNLPKWNLKLGSFLCQHLEFKHWIAVDIKFSLPIQGRLYPSHYSLLYFTKGSRPGRFSPPRIPIDTCRHCGGELRDYGGYKDRMNPRGVNITDVWTDLSPVRHARFKRRKSNELPLKMLDRILDISSREGDLVFDPFGGSGTTYIACELKGRRWLGSEIGDCGPIIKRFGNINIERELLEDIRRKVNVLFTEEALQLRSRNGHDTTKYRLSEEIEKSAKDKQGQLFSDSIKRKQS